MKKLVLTGAAGRLGAHLREPLSKLCETFVSSDMVDDIGDLLPNETYKQVRLNDADAVNDLLDGADMVIHFGGQSDERPFDEILQSNIIGCYNIWEAAYQKGVRRVIFASSIHAVGMYPKTEFIGTDVMRKPDGFYGLSKCFAEDLGYVYWVKRGLESVHIRILTCAEVTNTRTLGTWLSVPDLVQLVTRAIDTPTVGHTVVYGVSDNDRVPVDNARASFLGYRPRDNAEKYADRILAQAGPADPQDPAQTCHGGLFVVTDLGESGQALMAAADAARSRD